MANYMHESFKQLKRTVKLTLNVVDMKTSVVFFLFLTSASAFTNLPSKCTSVAMKMGENQNEDPIVDAYGRLSYPSREPDFVNEAIDNDLPEITKLSDTTMSSSTPFLNQPSALDGTLAGDVGFDPLSFSKSEDDLVKYREAEIKHARLAMLVGGFIL